MSKKKIIKNKYLKITQIAIYINAIIWIVFSVVSFLSGRQYFFKGINIYDFYSLVMILYGVGIMVLAKLLERKSKCFYRITLITLFVTSVLTFTDQVGIIDLVILFITLIPLVLLLKFKSSFIK